MDSATVSITSVLVLAWCCNNAAGAEAYHPDYKMEYDLGPGGPAFDGDERLLRKRMGESGPDFYGDPYDKSMGQGPFAISNANPEPDFHPDHLENDPYGYLSKRQSDYEETNDPRSPTNQRRISKLTAERLRRRRQNPEAVRVNSPVAQRSVLRPKRQNSVQDTLAFKAMRESKFPAAEAVKRFSRSSPPPSPESNEFFGHRTKFARAMKDRIEDPAEWGEGSRGRSSNQFNKEPITLKPKFKRELFQNKYATAPPPPPLLPPQEPQAPERMYDWRNESPDKTNFGNNGEGQFRNQLPSPPQEDELKYPDFGGNYEYDPADYRESDSQGLPWN